MADKKVLLQNTVGDNLYPVTKGSCVRNSAGENLKDVEAAAQVNKIESISINGTEQPVDDNKNVDLDVASAIEGKQDAFDVEYPLEISTTEITRVNHIITWSNNNDYIYYESGYSCALFKSDDSVGFKTEAENPQTLKEAFTNAYFDIPLDFSKYLGECDSFASKGMAGINFYWYGYDEYSGGNITFLLLKETNTDVIPIAAFRQPTTPAAEGTSSCTCGFLTGNWYFDEGCIYLPLDVDHCYYGGVVGEGYTEARRGSIGIYMPYNSSYGIFMENLGIKNYQFGLTSNTCSSGHWGIGMTNSDCYELAEKLKSVNLIRVLVQGTVARNSSNTYIRITQQ